MKGISGSFAFIAVCAITLCVAGPILAQDMEVRPGSWDFGEVVIGESAIGTFEFESMGPTAVWAYVMGLKNSTDPYAEVFSPIPEWSPTENAFVGSEWGLGAFSLDPSDPAWELVPACKDGGSIYQCSPDDVLFVGYMSGFLPREMPVGELFTVHVTFTPSAPGDYQAFLYLFSNDSIDPPGMEAHILLEGTGLAATVPEPASVLLIGTGLGLIGLVAWRKKK